MSRRILTPILVLAALACGGAVAGDVLRPQNTTRKDIGAIVDGVRADVGVNDESYVMPTYAGLFGTLFPVIPIAQFTTSAGEVIGFARRRPPVLIEDVGWTDADNTVELPFEDEYAIDVRVWIVDPSPDLPAHAAESGVTVSQIWAQERQGVAFSSFDVVDASDDFDAPTVLDIDWSTCGNLPALIGFVPDIINVYYVETVDIGGGPSTTSGCWCGGGIIVMGRSTSEHLLAHEIGHAFSLGHTNAADTLFDTTNVMHNASNNRKYLTEGQTFRAVFNPSSDLNDRYDVRAGQPTRSCAHHYSQANAACPGVQKRIWADGVSWPPN